MVHYPLDATVTYLALVIYMYSICCEGAVFGEACKENILSPLRSKYELGASKSFLCHG